MVSKNVGFIRLQGLFFGLDCINESNQARWRKLWHLVGWVDAIPPEEANYGRLNDLAPGSQILEAVNAGGPLAEPSQGPYQNYAFIKKGQNQKYFWQC